MRHHARRDAADDPDAIPVALRVIERGVAPTPRFSREDTLDAVRRFEGSTARRCRPPRRPRRRRRDGGVGVRHETHGVGRSGVRGALQGTFPHPVRRRSGRRRRRRRDRPDQRRDRHSVHASAHSALRPLRPLRCGAHGSPRRVYRSFAASRSRGRGCRSRGFALGVPGRRRHGPRSPSTPRVDPSAASTRRRGGGAPRRQWTRSWTVRTSRRTFARRSRRFRRTRRGASRARRRWRARSKTPRKAMRKLAATVSRSSWRASCRIRFLGTLIQDAPRVRRRRRARTDATSRFERSRRPGTEPGRRGSRRRVLVVATRRDARLSQNRRRRRRRRGGPHQLGRHRTARLGFHKFRAVGGGRPPRRARRSRRARSALRRASARRGDDRESRSRAFAHSRGWRARLDGRVPGRGRGGRHFDDAGSFAAEASRRGVTPEDDPNVRDAIAAAAAIAAEAVAAAVTSFAARRERWRAAADAAADLDALLCFAARGWSRFRPTRLFDDDDDKDLSHAGNCLSLRGSWHPLARALGPDGFVRNDVALGDDGAGQNSAGAGRDADKTHPPRRSSR